MENACHCQIGTKVVPVPALLPFPTCPIFSRGSRKLNLTCLNFPAPHHLQDFKASRLQRAVPVTFTVTVTVCGFCGVFSRIACRSLSSQPVNLLPRSTPYRNPYNLHLSNPRVLQRKTSADYSPYSATLSLQRHLAAGFWPYIFTFSRVFVLAASKSARPQLTLHITTRLPGAYKTSKVPAAWVQRDPRQERLFLAAACPCRSWPLTMARRSRLLRSGARPSAIKDSRGFPSPAVSSCPGKPSACRMLEKV